jgi:hypothetical protein
MSHRQTHRSAATLEALGPQFVPDGGYVGTALGDTLAKVVAVGIEQHGPTAGRRPFGVLACPQEDGLPNRLECQALCSKPYHFLVACQSRCTSINAQLLPGQQWQHSIGVGELRLRRPAHNQLSSLTQPGVVTQQQPLNRLAQINQKMPPISNLLC